MFDLTVVGGGMVGASIAAYMAQQGWQVALVEAQQPEPFEASQPADLRVSAVSQRSQQWLEQSGAWQAVTAMRLCPYRRLQAFERPEHSVEFNAASINQSELGHIVENRLLQLACWQQFPKSLQLFCPARVTALQQDADSAQLTLDNGDCLHSRLVIAADGARSTLRQLAGMGTRGWRYAQGCLVAHVVTELPQQDVTWQQFTESGPKAFLPLPGQQGSLVWYDSVPKVQQLAAMSPAALSQAMMAAFPAQLGQIEVQRATWFPLQRLHALSYYEKRLVLVGDAAHAIHPMAGQGVNLGFADAALLCQLLQEKGVAVLEQPQMLLARYQQQRQPQNWLMMSSMDALYQGFCSRWPLVRQLRQLGLVLAGRSALLKKLVTRYATG